MIYDLSKGLKLVFTTREKLWAFKWTLEKIISGKIDVRKIMSSITLELKFKIYKYTQIYRHLCCPKDLPSQALFAWCTSAAVNNSMTRQHVHVSM